ncbi:1-phosphofructokinase family hexose kinase [Mammaliicoccus sciuri]|uniref:1-phosphofructokinase family hexose kinase n=1 Tax=Mammaliicoccus sciuri TaxID=1296 RepID=UPI0018DDC0B7|nr:hexose kinase [Mammaliicoccus sciuri]QPW12824.1 hexose kinase [Mammaliicoccus sciuri]
MILTNTLNPSIDISYQVESLKIGAVHRPTEMIKNAGGKGINVTKVLDDLDADVTATGYLGGTNGQWIQTQLEQRNIQLRFIDIEGNTRQCIAINDGEHQTEILEGGPEVSETSQALYLKQLKNIAHHYKVVTISGSTPKLMNQSKTAYLIKILNTLTNSYNIVDIDGQSLKAILGQTTQIHAIKPNQSEFEDLVNQKGLSHQDIIKILKTNQLFKDVDVLVTLGSEGAIIKLKQSIYKATLPNINAVNPVGSGDATVAGIAYSVEHDLDTVTTIQTALACGTSNAMQAATGNIIQQEVDDLIKKVGVEKLG